MRRRGRYWRVDEIYLKVRGRRVYLYRPAEMDGDTIDCRLSPKKDVGAAKLHTQERTHTA
jgi:transposase-like protein